MNPNLYQTIIELQGIDFALCDTHYTIVHHSSGLQQYALDQTVAGLPLTDLFYELYGLESELEKVQTGVLPSLKIEKINRPGADGRSTYITFYIVPYQPGLLVLVIDTTAEGELEQRVTQQRNEISLLAKQLDAARTQLDDLIHRYLPASVADQMIADPSQAKPGGSQQEVTILFADLRGFTTWSEHLPPEEMVQLLNQKLSMAAEAIIAHDGLLDKFMGDAVMGIFNSHNHAIQAIQAAWQFTQALQDEPIRFSIGINTGSAVLGNIGTYQAMNYTAIGDAVNQAKRLQEMALSGQIFISGDTYQHVKEKVKTNSLGMQRLRGRQQLVTVYEVTGIM